MTILQNSEKKDRPQTITKYGNFQKILQKSHSVLCSVHRGMATPLHTPLHSLLNTKVNRGDRLVCRGSLCNV